MRASEREALRRLYQFRCGYCGVRESDVGSELTVDHFQPLSSDGMHAAENWVYSCHACNEFKSDFWDPGATRRVLHPLCDPIAAHVVEEPDGTLTPLTDTGAFHIEWLHLNRPALIDHRRERRLAEFARTTQARILDHLAKLDARIAKVIAALRALQSEQGDE